MGFLDGLFNPTKNTQRAYSSARKDFEQARGVTDPFYSGQVRGGTAASTKLQDLLGLNGRRNEQTARDAYMTSPGYDFTFNQGTRAIDNSGAAAGMGKSGAQLKALQGYGQGLYAQDYNSYLQQLAAMQGYGSQGASGLSNNSQITGNYLIGKGQAQDSGNQAAAGNAIGLATTVLGGFAGMPTGMSSGLSSLFGGGAPIGLGGQMANASQVGAAPSYGYTQTGQLNPFMLY